ncbi:tripartite tricarboxylate transporter permease [Candidatus Woesearchaeota archaeon]|nr:tripartite tricarboxylate transporter permease [Candidatus Woesearchaeota archaeon]MBW3018130.1 tripartite tricarboxylate transporter permease [Candidatus Woesearchaeota archaeon]
MLFILAAILIGCAFGIVTGLIPGIHVNLVALLLLSISPVLLHFVSPIVLAVFIVSLAVTHTFLDFIPSALLGIPDEDTALAIMPAHKLVLEGKAFECVKLTVIGSLLSVLSSIAIIPVLILLLPPVFEKINPVMGYILIVIVGFMILKEKTKNNKFWAFVVCGLSGVLGYLILNNPLFKDPLFPLLSGLFGTSMLINSLFQKTQMPKQRITEDLEISKKTIAKSLAGGTIAGSMTGLFPGVGAAQAGIIGSVIVGDIGVLGYLILQGAINTVNFLISLVTLFTIEKARNGAVIVVLEIMGKLTLPQLITIIACALVVAGIATYLALFFAKVFSKIIEKVNYTYLSVSIILLITTLVFVFCGFIGLVVLAVSTCLGLVPIYLGIGKNHSMGCLLIPVILYFIV